MTTPYRSTGSLDAFVKAGKKDTRVLGSVERYVLTTPRDEEPRRHDVLHPSEMSGPDWCHRASYFQLLGHAPADRKFSFKLLSVFEEGHSIHAKWQGWFHGMGNLYGLYKCRGCGSKFWNMGNTPCSDCEAVEWDYNEVPLNYEPLRISGHSDGWLIGFGNPLMLEIKSVGVGTFRYEAPQLLKENDNDFEKTWKKLTEPFGKHVTQIQIYMKLAELIGYPDVPQEAVLIYEAKATQDIKEFVVPKSDFSINHIFAAAERIVKAVDNLTPLDCNISPTGCKKCEGYKNESN